MNYNRPGYSEHPQAYYPQVAAPQYVPAPRRRRPHYGLWAVLIIVVGTIALVGLALMATAGQTAPNSYKTGQQIAADMGVVGYTGSASVQELCQAAVNSWVEMVASADIARGVKDDNRLALDAPTAIQGCVDYVNAH